jgi:hypothetical protein
MCCMGFATLAANICGHNDQVTRSATLLQVLHALETEINKLHLMSATLTDRYNTIHALMPLPQFTFYTVAVSTDDGRNM